MKYLSLCLAGVLISAQSLAQIDVSANDRTSLQMTIYNSDFAVIRDERSVELAKGDVVIEITDVPRTIQPQTVTMRSDQKNGFLADQQNYRYDLLNRQLLLERFVGRKVKYSRSLLEDGTYETVLREGHLLSINPEIVMFGDVIEIEPEGTISLPSLPSDLRTRPTLVFKGKNSDRGRQKLGLSYHAGGIGWEADYTLVLGKRSNLSGWLTVHNHSGSDFELSGVRLVAGEVNKAQPRMMKGRQSMAMEAMSDAVLSASLSTPKAAGDYHSYEYPGEVSLLKNDMTQLHLIEAAGVSAEKIYRLVSQVQRYANESVEEQSPVAVISFDNNRKNDLGVPLPAGVVRVYETQSDHELFVGEGRISHEAAGGEVEVEIGRVFDVKVRRTQTGYRRLGDRAVELAYRLDLSNAKDKPVTVFLEERISGEWTVIKQSSKGEEIDARTLAFKQSVPARGKASITYSIRVDW